MRDEYGLDAQDHERGDTIWSLVMRGWLCSSTRARRQDSDFAAPWRRLERGHCVRTQTEPAQWEGPSERWTVVNFDT